MRQPPFLHKGSKIYLVAPSFGVTEQPYRSYLRKAISNFKKRGYQVIIGKNVRLNIGEASSNTPAKRAEEIMEAFESDADLILSVAGGELEAELLPYLDYGRIASLPPKWFMGFSDNTNLTLALTTRTDTQTIYGPCATAFAQYPFILNREDAFRLLEGERRVKGYKKWEREGYPKDENPDGELNLTEKKEIRASHYEGPFEGILLGGCLDCLAALCGTRFDQVLGLKERLGGERIIWYFEACDLGPIAIRRAIFQLQEAGWLDNAAGFLIGRSKCLEATEFGMNAYWAYRYYLRNYGVPLLLDVDLGHLPPSMPLINGAKARVSLQKGNIVIDYR